MTIRQRASLGFFVLLSAFLLALQPFSLAQAQDDPAICEAITRDTMTQVGVNCADLPIGSVCYAAPEVSATFTSPVDEDYFSVPGDSVDILPVTSVSAASFDGDAETWGTSVFSLQANLPSGFDDGVRMIGFGGVEIETAVEADALFTPLAEPIASETNADTDLRAATLTDPNNSDVIDEVAAGTSVFADAISEDGDWVRVIAGERAGWIAADALEDIDLDELPVYSTSSRTPLQAFNFRSLDTGACGSAMSSLLIQGPEDTVVDLVINDVVVRIESTALFRTRFDPSTNQFIMDVIVLFGLVRLNPGTPQELLVPAGFFISVILNYTPGDFGVTDPPNLPRLIRYSPLSPLVPAILRTLLFLNGLPPNILVYIFDLPIVTQPSGVGGVVIRIRFINPRAVLAANRLCQAGQLPDDVCEILGF